jgi:hypothetical protein
VSGLKATPGPWFCGDEDEDTAGVEYIDVHAGSYGDRSYTTIAHVQAPWAGDDWQALDNATRANARLIAAAPDLYDALDPTNVRKAARLLTDAGHGLHAGLLVLMADAQERALAKARGESK